MLVYNKLDQFYKITLKGKDNKDINVLKRRLMHHKINGIN